MAKVTCIFPHNPYPDLADQVVMPMHGLPLLATILRDAGHDVRVFIEDVAPIDWSQVEGSDVVAFSFLAPCWSRFEEIAHRIREQWGIPMVVGGTFPTYMATRILAKHPHLVVGKHEGDELLPELVEALVEGRDLSEVAGIAYVNDAGELVHTARRPVPTTFETIPDYSLIHGYDDLARVPSFIAAVRKQLPMPVIQTSRGCPYRCNFCIVPHMFGPIYRTRSIDGVIDDLKARRKYGRAFFIVDNHFTANPKRTAELLERIIREELGLRFVAFSRLEVGKDRELLRLLRRAGVRHLLVGIESIDGETLDSLNKNMDHDLVENAIDQIHLAGIGLYASFVVGSDRDTAKTPQKIFDFVKRKGIASFRIFPKFVLPSEASSYDPCTQITDDWECFNGNYVVYFPQNVRPSELQEEIMRSHEEAVRGQRILRSVLSGRLQAAFQNFQLRGRTRALRESVNSYLPVLEAAERGRYDERGIFLNEASPQLAFQSPCGARGSGS